MKKVRCTTMALLIALSLATFPGAAFGQDLGNFDATGILNDMMREQIASHLRGFAAERGVELDELHMNISSSAQGITGIVPIRGSMLEISERTDLAMVYFLPKKGSSARIEGGYYTLRLRARSLDNARLLLVDQAGRVAARIPATIQTMVRDTDKSLDVNGTDVSFRVTNAGTLAADIHSIPGGCWWTIGGRPYEHGDCWIIGIDNPI